MTRGVMRFLCLAGLCPQLCAAADAQEAAAPPCAAEHGACDAAGLEDEETSAIQLRRAASGLGHNHSLEKTKGDCDPSVVFFDFGEFQEVLPAAPPNLPETLHGFFWLDQIGYYGFANMSLFAPQSDFIMSFGDAYKPWNPEERTITLVPWGKSWTWFNTQSSYALWGGAKAIDYSYDFEFNADFTFAKIILKVDLGLLGKWSVPSFLVSFTMHTQSPPLDACPPPQGATKKMISQCAAWERVSTLLPGWPFLEYTEVYYLYKVADNEGNKIQPTFDVAQQWALEPENNQPNPKLAKKWLGINDLQEAGGMVPGRPFDAAQMSAAPGWDSCNPARPCQDLWTPWGIFRCLSAFLGDLH